MSAKSDREKAASTLRTRVTACTVCAASLPAGPRPIVQFSASATVLVIGQAPGAKVHASGAPWQDDSGDRLRAWMGIGADDFYDPVKWLLRKVAGGPKKEKAKLPLGDQPSPTTRAATPIAKRTSHPDTDE